ncbi:MAG: penicillin-binding protein 2 [Actinobacteria bacterium]|nr:penicillin-binding protein 2 [Actinomycetota bacterium]
MSSVRHRPRVSRFLPPDPRVEEPYRVTPPMALRIAILGFVAILLFAGLFFRLWALQVISGERYLEEAKNNQVRTFRAPATRGTISDRDGDLLVSNVPGTAIQLWPAALDEMPAATRTAVVRRVSRLLGVPAKEIHAALRRRANDPLTPVTIKENVRDAKVQYLLEHQAKFPGVQVAQTELRNYEQGVLASQLLGYVGEISAEQLEARRHRGYAVGDRIGQTGIEASYDRYLRGVAGVGQVRVDALGRITSDREFSQLPESGYSLRLTIDDDVQRAAEEALRYGIRLAHEEGEWAASGGAIVAMDPHNGEVLAMASHPTFDPSVYVGRVDPKKLERLADPQANYPTLNRAVAGLYPPGSTFKPVTALAAIHEGFLTPDEVIQCTGKRVVGEDKQVFMNWDPTKNEPMTLTTAIANSCDTYFYEVALRAYERRDTPIQTWARRMGFGTTTGFDIGPEGDGLIPTPAWRRRTFTNAVDKLWKSGDSVQLGIGQGDVLVTPLQMTRFFALLANGGKLVKPHVVKQIEQPTPEGDSTVVIRPITPPPPKDIGLDPSTIRVVQEGLYDATHTSYGTATSVFGSFPVAIAGKTGTAEKYIQLPGFKGLRDQSWWCGYGPYEKPELAVCAVIENGGYGGEAAAPAALKVFEEFFDVTPGSYLVRTVQSD